MPAAPWDRFLTERDKTVFGLAQLGRHTSFPQRPALLVVDATLAFCGDRPEPLEASVRRWPSSCGLEGWSALEKIADLLLAARRKGLPVIYTTNGWRKDKWDMGSWLWKVSGVVATRSETGDRLDPHGIMPQIAPSPQDIVIVKQKPSAFFGTPLQSYLTLLGCDGVIVAGLTTSGCVRATAVDAFNNNLRVVLAWDGCADRCEASHAMSLFDLGAKTAELTDSADICTAIEGLPALAFALPKGV